MPNEPDRKYVRVYYNDLIRDYPEIWADNDRLATWLRLLATADPMWPTPPELPRSVKPRVFGQLVDSSLVTTAGEGRYRMKGLDAEREMRSQNGRNAAAKRWHSEGTPAQNADPLPSTRPSRAEYEPSNPDGEASGPDILDDYYRLTTRFPTSTTATWLTEIANEFGADATSRMLATVYTADRSSKTLISRLENELRAAVHAADRASLVREKERLEADAASKRITPEQAESNQRRLAEIMAEMMSGEKAS